MNKRWAARIRLACDIAYAAAWLLAAFSMLMFVTHVWGSSLCG